jgi:hypothetical protein
MNYGSNKVSTLVYAVGRPTATWSLYKSTVVSFIIQSYLIRIKRISGPEMGNSSVDWDQLSKLLLEDISPNVVFKEKIEQLVISDKLTVLLKIFLDFIMQHVIFLYLENKFQSSLISTLDVGQLRAPATLHLLGKVQRCWTACWRWS